jgi:hypothetical protein
MRPAPLALLLVLAPLWVLAPAPAGAEVRSESAARSSADSAIAGWARGGPAMRRRSDEAALPVTVRAGLLSVLAASARPCDCSSRRIRWAWPLRHARDGRHPRMVVAFSDAPRGQGDVIEYLRFALLRYVQGHYVVTSAMAFPRRWDGELAVRVLGKRDLDGDGDEDISLQVSEPRADGPGCSVGRFMTGKNEASLEDVPCGAD